MSEPEVSAPTGRTSAARLTVGTRVWLSEPGVFLAGVRAIARPSDLRSGAALARHEQVTVTRVGRVTTDGYTQVRITTSDGTVTVAPPQTMFAVADR
jgi:hypothetical protein